MEESPVTVLGKSLIPILLLIYQQIMESQMQEG